MIFCYIVTSGRVTFEKLCYQRVGPIKLIDRTSNEGSSVNAVSNIKRKGF